MGLRVYGKDRADRSRRFVPSRVVSQIRTHAQKHCTKTTKGHAFPLQAGFVHISGKMFQEIMSSVECQETRTVFPLCPRRPIGVHELPGIEHSCAWRPRTIISHGGGKIFAPKQHRRSSTPRLCTGGRHSTLQDKVRSYAPYPPTEKMRPSVSRSILPINSCIYINRSGAKKRPSLDLQ